MGPDFLMNTSSLASALKSETKVLLTSTLKIQAAAWLYDTEHFQNNKNNSLKIPWINVLCFNKFNTANEPPDTVNLSQAQSSDGGLSHLLCSLMTLDMDSYYEIQVNVYCHGMTSHDYRSVKIYRCSAEPSALSTSSSPHCFDKNSSDCVHICSVWFIWLAPENINYYLAVCY